MKKQPKNPKQPTSPPKPELGKGDWKNAKTMGFKFTMEKAPTDWYPLQATCKKCGNLFLALLKNGDRIPVNCRECGGGTSTWRCEWKHDDKVPAEGSLAMAT